MCVGDGGGELFIRCSPLKCSIDGLSKTCVSMALNQIKVMMTVPACVECSQEEGWQFLEYLPQETATVLVWLDLGMKSDLYQDEISVSGNIFPQNKWLATHRQWGCETYKDTFVYFIFFKTLYQHILLMQHWGGDSGLWSTQASPLPKVLHSRNKENPTYLDRGIHISFVHS